MSGRGGVAGVVVVVGAVAALSGCVDYGNLGSGDAVGTNGKVIFSTETNLVFTTRLAVGSTFAVVIQAKDDKDAKEIASAALLPDDQTILEVDSARRVHIVGPGAGELRVVGVDGVIDFLPIHAGFAGATTLVDNAMLSAVSAVDARLPASFATLNDTDISLAVSAIDRCGAEMLDLHASTIETSGVDADITEAGPGNIVLHPKAAGDLGLVLKTPGLDDLAYDAASIERDDVDEVQVAVASVSDGAATMWGRAFSNDRELAGANDFSWSADERVTLSSTSGPSVNGAVAFAPEGQQPDVRPAVVTAEIFGESGTVDLVSPNTTTITSRGTPAREFDPPDSNPGGCGGGDKACDPEAATGAAALVLAGGLRRKLRALRNGSGNGNGNGNGKRAAGADRRSTGA